MSRATSQESPKTLPSEFGPVVLEEKSPTLMAQEALARMQIMASNLAEQARTGIKESAPPVSKSKSEMEETRKDSQPTEILVISQKTANDQKRKEEISMDDKSLVEQAPPIATMPMQPQTRTSEVVVTKKKIGALSLNDLLTLYHNPQLAYNESFVDNFVQVRGFYFY